VGGWVERHVVRYFTVDAWLTGSIDAASATSMLDEAFDAAIGPVAMLAFRFNYCLAPTLQGFAIAHLITL
jgi:hypothetical protein